MTLAPWPLAEYELLPLPTLSPELLGAIVRRHGLDLDGPIVAMHSTGVVHALWALGSQWVLRVPKDEAMCIGDHRCEAIAIPLARAAGVRTPGIVAFNDSGDILDVPYSIVERIDGHDLVSLRQDNPAHDATYRQLGVQLALLHRVGESSTPHPWLREPEAGPAEALFDEASQAGLIHEDGITWLQNLVTRLDDSISSGPPAPRVLLHNDVKPDNAMLDRRGSLHLIDWGDAGYGDPVLDFHSLPLRSAQAALQGYRANIEGDLTLETRLIRRVVARSISGLRRTPRLGPSWYRPIAATLTDLFTFSADHPDLWRAWTYAR